MARANPRSRPIREEKISEQRAKEIMSSTPALTEKALAELAGKKRRMEE